MPDRQPILEDERIDQMADLLDARAVPFKGLNLEALDGFLSALSVSPETIADDAWQPLVWGGKPPRWADDAEADDVAALLAAHRALCAQRVQAGDDLPDRLLPLVWLPEEPDAEHPDTLDVGRDWAAGFLQAVALCEPEWEAWIDAHDWIDEAFVLLDRLASGEVVGDDPTAPASALDYRERLDIIASLPGVLADLHVHRIDMLTPRVPRLRGTVIERNAACPCGSGRKYKKCCAP